MLFFRSCGRCKLEKCVLMLFVVTGFVYFSGVLWWWWSFRPLDHDLLPQETDLTKHDVIITRKSQQQQQQQITTQYGPQPVILFEQESCTAFRNLIPPTQRNLAAAGMFSTGTNLVTQLLKRNCVIPERAALYSNNNKQPPTKEELGIRWQVPWGKHTPAHYWNQHVTTHAKSINKTTVLPVVMIRNPWQWMKSMCKNSYTAKWKHYKKCPNLMSSSSSLGNTTTTTTTNTNTTTTERWNPVTVKYGAGTDSYKSLIHLWMDWYQQYIRIQQQQQQQQQDHHFPILIVRMEDLIFYTHETIKRICSCVGGIVPPDDDDNNNNITNKFAYVMESAKADSPGHDTSTGFAQAWEKYSRPLLAADFDAADYQAALMALQQQDEYHLMELLQYQHPV